jgi:acyl-CoA reductase-like NAD-dependent aldehyde dehydrogenase
MPYQSINPNDGKLLKSFEYMAPAQLEKALAGAQHCYQTWKHRSYAERAVVLNKAAALLHAHVDDFAKLETLEMGKCINEARGVRRKSWTSSCRPLVKLASAAIVLGPKQPQAVCLLDPTNRTLMLLYRND